MSVLTSNLHWTEGKKTKIGQSTNRLKKLSIILFICSILIKQIIFDKGKNILFMNYKSECFQL